MPNSSSIILAFVGMPGAGKSEAAAYLRSKQIPFVRFGDLTEKRIQEKGLPLTPENEQLVRETIRKDEGMIAYAQYAKPTLEALSSANHLVGIDGLYSWEEYLYLQSIFPSLVVVHVFAEKKIRYGRLSIRPVRPFTKEEAQIRDKSEIENLNKGGPIAMADYLINNSTSLEELHTQLDMLLEKLHI